jgi:MFS family permease
MNAVADEIQPVRLLRRQNIAPLILVNLGVGLHATIWYMATTAMPSAVEELDAAAYLSWATSLYLMTSILGGAMLPPIKSRFGPRNSMMTAGLVVVLGGVLAGAAPDVSWILAGRAIQGLGEGFLLALSYCLVRELFDNALVPRVGGVEAVTWACAVTIGPLLGGWLTDLGTWRFA